MDREIVEITWVDACEDDGHIEIEGVKQIRPLERRNVGYIIDQNDEFVIIGWGVIHNFFKGLDACSNVFAIPKAMITKWTRLV